MQLELDYPVKPFAINQGFGANPDYYARFHDRFGNPEHGHMGIDMRAAHGTAVYAACDGIAHFEKDSHGGEGIYVFTPVMDDGNQYQIIYWHLCGDTDANYPSPFPLDGKPYPVQRGQLIGYADNSGAPFESTGDHLHFGLRAYTPYGAVMNADNGFDGCINPAPHFTGKYAQNNAVAAPIQPAPAVPAASDQIAAFAEAKQAAGNTAQANVLFALARFLKAFGK